MRHPIIEKRRRQLLVHRYLYYVRCASLISDGQYDVWERELRELVLANPEAAAASHYADDCPTQHVGSSNLDDYPRELQLLGDSLLAFNERWPFGYLPGEQDDDVQPVFVDSMFG